jgi:hypothetical protein
MHKEIPSLALPLSGGGKVCGGCNMCLAPRTGGRVGVAVLFAQAMMSNSALSSSWEVFKTLAETL